MKHITRAVKYISADGQAHDTPEAAAKHGIRNVIGFQGDPLGEALVDALIDEAPHILEILIELNDTRVSFNSDVLMLDVSPN